MKSVSIASGYGLLAGAVAALTLWMMQQLSGLIWSGSDSRWYVVTVILGGGVLLALL